MPAGLERGYATPLAMYAAKQFRAGRKVAGKVRGKRGGDVSAAVERGLVQVASISRFDRKLAAWQDITLADGRVTPADLAAFRLDFAAWMRRLPNTLRQIANCLALGEKTKDVAARFGLTAGRISQIRRTLELSWQAFQGEAA